MTTIVGLHREGEGTWLGSDLMTSFGGMMGGIVMGPTTKVYRNGRWAWSHAGHTRAGNAVEKRAAKIFTADCPLEVADRIKAALVEIGFQFGIPAEDGSVGAPCSNQTFLLASGDGLWVIGEDFGVTQIPTGIPFVDGCGHKFGMGAAMALLEQELPPETLITKVIELTSRWTSGSGFGSEVVFLPATARARKLRVVSHR